MEQVRRFAVCDCRITHRGAITMTSRYATVVAIASLLLVTACANTIRGIGKDAANTVNATENAGQRVANATK
jgi:predicted small secreted protein